MDEESPKYVQRCWVSSDAHENPLSQGPAGKEVPGRVSSRLSRQGGPPLTPDKDGPRTKGRKSRSRSYSTAQQRQAKRQRDVVEARDPRDAPDDSEDESADESPDEGAPTMPRWQVSEDLVFEVGFLPHLHLTCNPYNPCTSEFMIEERHCGILQMQPDSFTLVARPSGSFDAFTAGLWAAGNQVIRKARDPGHKPVPGRFALEVSLLLS